MVRERLATEVVPRYYRLPAPEDFVLRSHLIPVTSALKLSILCDSKLVILYHGCSFSALVGHQYLNVNPSNFMVMNNSFQNLLSGAVLELISRVSYVRTL
ncbi:hypothetical protein T4A_5483 [Trichinella pseudospiralis]|uniref:Uncharacterized protein n=1 Tax=Trichinella pseudospiralis TaxID=6337 RepID=A0A0V1EIQ5_TRIPS|nr:hypothetical protein T4A_5483 [Trichinella pseudospiralis]